MATPGSEGIRRRSWRSGLAIFLVSASVTGAFVINLCDLIYRCGCRAWWAGAADHCNIHISGVRHCPWCSIGTSGFAIVVGFVLLPQGILSFWPHWNFLRRLGASLMAFPVFGLVAGLAVGWMRSYWS